jgi:2-polyprenyl-6-methoxyphenol hydroxylase-like FAD-dependent oxidoreductase
MYPNFYHQLCDVGLNEAYSADRIAKLARLAAPPAQLAVKDYPVLENWVHDSGRMVVIGEAAHPLPVG